MPPNVSWISQLLDALVFAMIGAAIGVGQSMRDRERDLFVIAGRALCTAGLAAAAGIVLIWWPELPFVGQIGVAAGLASLGTSFLEKLASKYLQSRGD